LQKNNMKTGTHTQVPVPMTNGGRAFESPHPDLKK